MKQVLRDLPDLCGSEPMGGERVEEPSRDMLQCTSVKSGWIADSHMNVP